MKTDVLLSIPEPMWRRALEFATRTGHDIEREVVIPAVLEYVKVQADVRGYKLGRCAACNVTTVDSECLECGWVATTQMVPA